MAEKSAIAWTEATWNPWHGCHKVGAGCLNCYMFREKKRLLQDPEKVVRSKTTFGDPLKWKEPKTIFACSWSDFFIEEADPWREEALKIIRNTPQHRYLILTKRPERIPRGFAPPPNVWMGVTVEDMRSLWRHNTLVERLFEPDQIFMSCEPLLGHILLPRHNITTVNWIIVGGESGPDARPMQPVWAEMIRDQCFEYDVPFFFKQMGGNKKIDGVWGGNRLYGAKWEEVPWQR